MMTDPVYMLKKGDAGFRCSVRRRLQLEVCVRGCVHTHRACVLVCCWCVFQCDLCGFACVNVGTKTPCGVLFLG